MRTPSRRVRPRRLAAGLLVVVLAFFLVGHEGSPGRTLLTAARHAECFVRPKDGGVSAVGDSITAGHGRASWGFLAEDSWFAQAICTADLDYGSNAAIPSWTAAMVLDDQLPRMLRRRPRVVAVLVGTNDVLRRLPPESSMAAVSRILDEIRAAGATPVLGAVPPLAFDARRVAAFNRALRSVASREHVRFIDFHDAVADGTRYAPGNTDDGVHPNAAGATAMARVAIPVLRSALEEAHGPPE